MVGKVKWFNNHRGIGFIIESETKKEYFVHYSAISGDGFKTLKAEDEVSFDIGSNSNGECAVNVRSI